MNNAPNLFTRTLAGLSLALSASTLMAADAAAPREPDWPESQTELWLQLQREGEIASRRVQSATPAERERSMQRLLDSFEHPIPEYFGEDDGGSFER